MDGKKLIIILNGKPRAGKDTFAELLNELIPVYKYSAVEKVKCIALDCGWTGKKAEKDRKFLSELKRITTEYSDMAFRDIMEKVEQFDNGEIKEEILIVDVREPSEIARLVDATGAITVFIKNDNVPAVTSNYADANVENYNYDFIIHNNGTLEEFKYVTETFLDFLIGLGDTAEDEEDDE